MESHSGRYKKGLSVGFAQIVSISIAQSSCSLVDRKMVLKHHPDKKGDMTPSEVEMADAFFAKITQGTHYRGPCWTVTLINPFLLKPTRLCQIQRKSFCLIQKIQKLTIPFPGLFEMRKPFSMSFVLHLRETPGKFELLIFCSRSFLPDTTFTKRWIEQQPVPELGDENTPYEQVEAFYHFWYNAKSWREFGYHDEIQVTV